MATIRELFHEIGNWHNKISMCAGITKLKLKQKFKDNPIPREIKETLKKLTEVEKYTLKSNKVLTRLKGIIYTLTNPDIIKRKKKGG